MLRFFLATSLADSERESIESDLDMIRTIVIRTFFSKDRIHREDTPVSLSDLLEVRLRVDIESLLEDLRERGEDMSLDKFFDDRNTLIEVESTEESLEGIREDVSILMADRERLPT